MPRGLVARYRFEGNVQDALGVHSGKALPAGSGPTYVAGKVGQALVLDGADDYVEIPRTIAESFSIVFWVKTSQTAPGSQTSQWWEGNGIVDAETCSVQNDFGVALVGNHVSFGIGKQGGTDMSIHSQVAINNGTWHHVAAVRDQTDGTLEIHVDGGTPVTSRGGTHALTTPAFIDIGNNPCNLLDKRRFFGGQLDELMFFGRALTAAEIHTLYATQP